MMVAAAVVATAEWMHLLARNKQAKATASLMGLSSYQDCHKEVLSTLGEDFVCSVNFMETHLQIQVCLLLDSRANRADN